jgi:LCP family protein required for cell wall assembly
LSVAILAMLTVREVANRPLNPFGGSVDSPVAVAAQEVADISLDPLDQDGALPSPDLSGSADAAEEILTPIPTTTPADTNRVTVLVMGVDRRPGEPFISRTDSMMLLSVDPDTDTVSIMSIPRDLYVVIPGRGRDRINTAFVYGAAGNNPAGGAALAMQTVEYNLGVHVNHYVAVDFRAVEEGIDEIGGIDIYVPKEIYDPTFPDMNYGYDPLYVAAGLQSMDGVTALRYARTRHTDNDFNRAQRQQDVLLAVRDKVLALGLLEMTRLAPTLYQQLGDSVRTDMSLERLIGVATMASRVAEEDINTAVLDYNYVTSFTTETGAQVLILLNDRASPLIEELFYAAQ